MGGFQTQKPVRFALNDFFHQWNYTSNLKLQDLPPVNPKRGGIQTQKPVRFALNDFFHTNKSLSKLRFVCMKKARHILCQAFEFVGVAGFEPATPCSQSIILLYFVRISILL
jgi:hypothetical protein